MLVKVTGNPDARVDHLEANRRFCLVALRHGCAHDDVPMLGELDGIPDDIAENLSQPLPIAQHRLGHISRAVV